MLSDGASYPEGVGLESHVLLKLSGSFVENKLHIVAKMVEMWHENHRYPKILSRAAQNERHVNKIIA